MALKCPKCKRHNLLYVQETTEYFEVDMIYADGCVDLGGMEDSFPHDYFHYECESCGEIKPKHIKRLIKKISDQKCLKK
jgi:hypothetical protein